MNRVAVAPGVPLSSATRSALGQRATLPGRDRAGQTGMARAACIGAGDVVLMLGIAVAIPFVVLAVGLPIVLIVQLLLWLGRLV